MSGSSSSTTGGGSTISTSAVIEETSSGTPVGSGSGSGVNSANSSPPSSAPPTPSLAPSTGSSSTNTSSLPPNSEFLASIQVCPHLSPPGNSHCKICWKAFTQMVKSSMKEALGRAVELCIIIGRSRIPLCRCAGLDVVCRLGRRPGKFKQQRILADPERHSGMCAELFSPTHQLSNNAPPPSMPSTAGITCDKNLDSWWMHVATTFHKEELLSTGMFSCGATVISLPWKEKEEPVDDIDPPDWAVDIPRKRPRVQLEDSHSIVIDKNERQALAQELITREDIRISRQQAGDKEILVLCWSSMPSRNSSPDSSPTTTFSSLTYVSTSPTIHNFRTVTPSPLARVSPRPSTLPTSGPTPQINALLSRALVKISEGLIAPAVTILRQAVDISPNCLPAVSTLVWCYWTNPSTMADLLPVDAPPNNQIIELLRSSPAADLEVAEAFFTMHGFMPAATALLATFTLYVKGDTQRAAELWASAASRDCSQAKRALAVRYLRGDAAVADAQKGVQLLKQAAQLGDTPAHGWLGFCYENGIGVKQNWKKASRKYRLAAEKNEMEAQCSLGWLYEHGLGVKLNLAKAFKWYQESAKQGFADAQRRVAWMLWNSPNRPEGGETGKLEALRLFKLAAKQGHTMAILELTELTSSPPQVRHSPEIIAGLTAANSFLTAMLKDVRISDLQLKQADLARRYYWAKSNEPLSPTERVGLPAPCPMQSWPAVII